MYTALYVYYTVSILNSIENTIYLYYTVFLFLFTDAETLEELLEAMGHDRYQIQRFVNVLAYMQGKTDIISKIATNLYLLADIIEQHGLLMLPLN